MTFVGKILVIVIMIFALFFLAEYAGMITTIFWPFSICARTIS